MEPTLVLIGSVDSYEARPFLTLRCRPSKRRCKAQAIGETQNPAGEQLLPTVSMQGLEPGASKGSRLAELVAMSVVQVVQAVVLIATSKNHCHHGLQFQGRRLRNTMQPVASASTRLRHPKVLEQHSRLVVQAAKCGLHLLERLCANSLSPQATSCN